MAIDLIMTFQPTGTPAPPPMTIEVSSAAFNAEQILNIGSQSSGAGAGKVTFNPLTFTKRPDANSPDLWSRLCMGTPFQKVTLEARKSTGAMSAATAYLTFTMGLVVIKTITFSADDGDESPKETVTLEYGQIAYSFTPQDDKGTPGKPVASGWDRVKNISIDPTKVGTA